MDIDKSLIDKLKSKGYSEEDILNALNENTDEAEEMLKDPSKVKKTLDKASKICKNMKNIPFLGEYFNTASYLCMMIGDYVDGNYRCVPTATIISALVVLIYVVSPVDIMPDFIPIIGYLDDAIGIALVYSTLKTDIEDYREWKGI